MKWHGKTIALTGSTGGIGLLLAESLRQQGAQVITIGRARTDIPADLSTLAGIESAAAQLTVLEPDILINLAGLSFFGLMERESAEHASALLHVNLLAPLLLTQAVAPSMKRRHTGMIVNVGSVFGAIPFAYFAHYSASKAGLRALSDALRREWQDSGIEVVHVAPRAVNTPMNTEAVRQLAQKTNMKMDPPETVVRHILAAMDAGRAHTVIGVAERLLIKLHGLSTQLLDTGLRRQNLAAKAILSQSTTH